MVQAVILVDNTYIQNGGFAIRGTGAHRIATWLRQNGYTVEVVDFVTRWTPPQMEALFAKLIGPDTLFLGLGLSLMSLGYGNLPAVFAKFKQTYPHIKIVSGGSGYGYENLPVRPDYLIDGYAEKAVLDLMLVLDNKKSADQLKTRVDNRGLTWIFADQDYGDVDTTDLSIEFQSSDFITAHEPLAVETARGCVFSCKFCTYNLIGKQKFDYMRDPATIITELTNNYNRWGTTRYFISEDTFNDRIEKLEILAEAIKHLPFQPWFTGYLRADLAVSQTQAWPLFRQIGLRGAHFGIETLTPAACKIMGKNFNTEKIKQGLVEWKRYFPEMTTHATMILGIPDDQVDLHYQYRDFFETTGCIDNWIWRPLFVPSQHREGTKTNWFSQNFDQYFEHMTLEEIQEERRRQGDKSSLPPTGDNRFWKYKNGSLNFFSALRAADHINTISRTIKVNSWNIFAYTALGYDLDQVQTWTMHGPANAVPTQEATGRARALIADYIDKKLQFDYDKFYHSQPTVTQIRRKVFELIPAI